MKLNKEKLDQMVEAVMKITAPNRPIVENDSLKLFRDSMYKSMISQLRTALTPFCMEMTDEEIRGVTQNIMVTTSISGIEVLDDESTKVSRFYFTEGAKFIRDGNK